MQNKAIETRDNLMDIIKYVRKNYSEFEQDAIIVPLERAVFALAKVIKKYDK